MPLSRQLNRRASLDGRVEDEVALPKQLSAQMNNVYVAAFEVPFGCEEYQYECQPPTTSGHTIFETFDQADRTDR